MVIKSKNAMPIIGRKHKVICSKEFIKRFSKVADVLDAIKIRRNKYV